MAGVVYDRLYCTLLMVMYMYLSEHSGFITDVKVLAVKCRLMGMFNTNFTFMKRYCNKAVNVCYQVRETCVTVILLSGDTNLIKDPTYRRINSKYMYVTSNLRAEYHNIR